MYMTAQQLFLIIWFKLDGTDQFLFQSRLTNKLFSVWFRNVRIFKNQMNPVCLLTFSPVTFAVVGNNHIYFTYLI